MAKINITDVAALQDFGFAADPLRPQAIYRMYVDMVAEEISIVDEDFDILFTFSAGGSIGPGTVNRLAKFTPDGTHVGDSQLFDNGASVAIGTAAPNASALFQLESTTQGFLTPRMTTLQRNAIAAPATGLLVYNTGTSLFNYWDGGAWQEIDSNATSEWLLDGNTNGAIKYIGTNDAFAFPIRTNGLQRAIILSSGEFGINTAVPTATLHVTGTTADNTAYALKIDNSTPTGLLYVRNDGIELAYFEDTGLARFGADSYIKKVVGSKGINIHAVGASSAAADWTFGWNSGEILASGDFDGGNFMNVTSTNNNCYARMSAPASKYWDAGMLALDYIIRGILNADGSPTQILTIVQSGANAGNSGFGISTPTAKLQVVGANGYDQFNMLTPFTPANSADANGNVGDLAWDDNFIYMKVSTGWVRGAMAAF